jgi:hypothetical protein
MNEGAVSTFTARVGTPFVDRNVVGIVTKAPGNADQKCGQSERSKNNRDGEQENESK